MDPQACFEQWCKASSYAEAMTLQAVYHQWLACGGFKAKDRLGHEIERLKTNSTEDKRYAVFTGGQKRWIPVTP